MGIIIRPNQALHDDMGFDSSRQGGNRADIHGVTYDQNGRHGGCARFDGNAHLDLHYRVSSEFHYATHVAVTFWMHATFGQKML